MAQYDTVYAMIVIIGVLGFIIDAGFEALARPARRLGRAGARDRGGHDMTAHGRTRCALSASCRSRCCSRCGTASRRRVSRRRRCCRRRRRCSRGCSQQLGDPQFLEHVAITLFRLFAGFAIAVVVGVSLGRRRDRQPHCRGAAQAAGARAGAGAEGRALSGADPDPRLRPCLEDRAGRRRRHVPDPARDLSGHGGGRAEAGMVGARGRHLADARAVQVSC